ncbi:hypothetical protein VP01_1160g2 [Puccinia sorghi]|uniref:Uncharacterized protein n=1 Tax=Puccinia sorghi TaxID=27349 RepID=A0A0L6VRI8_9BASI|nr:hypothetical protein VP01_1160g2 [Puccinia sorghi]
MVYFNFENFDIYNDYLGKYKENFMEVCQKLLEKLNTHGKWYVNKQIMDQKTITKLKRRTEFNSKKPCGRGFWMCMPSMGEPLANAFQLLLFCFIPDKKMLAALN